MKRKQSLFLVGPMGAGKTTIGRMLAQAMQLEFIDTDHELQDRTGVDIPTIFEFEGEAGFRKRERLIIDELTQKHSVVLATGGGAVLDADNRRHLAARGIVIYLHCSPDQQYERTYRDKNRPLLQTEDPLKKLNELMEVREPFYQEVADIVVASERKNAQGVVKEILAKIKHLNET